MKKKKIEEYIGIGRRKKSVASVRLRPGGTGKVDVNGKAIKEYFNSDIQINEILAPFQFTSGKDGYDLIIRLKGGGIEGQVIATRLGISRALVTKDESLRQELKTCGFLTRDARQRERKKCGLAGARKSFQHSKR